MLWKWLRAFGLAPATATLSALAIALSVGITAAIQLLAYGDAGGLGLVIAIVAPLAIAPPFSYLTLRLLFQLDRAQSELRRLATTDDLTQAYNRRYFMELAEQEFARARRYGNVFCLAIFDLDDFKRVNDEFGHVAGDLVLREVSRLCREHIRQTDVFARYGGEEFVLLLPEADEAQGWEVTQRLQKEIAAHIIRFGDQHIRVTASAGLAVYSGTQRDFGALLQEADAALYKAKAVGKNHLGVVALPPINRT
jgi:diguanylate cyclase (GGDEF)-like protein